MKTLRLKAHNGILDYAPNFSNEGLYPGMEEPVQLEFDFSPELKSAAKVVAFYSPLGNEYPPSVLEDGKSCIVPPEALTKTSFKVQVLGKQLATNKLTVSLKGGIT